MVIYHFDFEGKTLVLIVPIPDHCLPFFTFLITELFEPRREKTSFLHICENKDADQLRGNREADQRLCFRSRIVQSLFFLNPKFPASSHLLWLYSPVCVGPGRNPRRPVFSQRGSFVTGPDGTRHHRLKVFSDWQVTGTGEASPEKTLSCTYLSRAPQSDPFPSPRGSLIGEIGWFNDKLGYIKRTPPIVIPR